MLGNLFRPRPSTASPSPAFQTGPTTAQQRNPKSSSKLFRKLKELKKALRPGRSGEKVIWMSLTVWGICTDTDPIDGTRTRTEQVTGLRELIDLALRMNWGNIAPGPFTAEDYEFCRAPPSLMHQNPGSNTHPTSVSPPTGALATIPAACPQPSVPVNPSSVPPAATLDTLTNASPFRQQPVPALQVESESPAIGRHLAGLRAAQPDIRDENAKVTRSRRPQAIVPASAPVIQRYNTGLATHQPAQEPRVLATKIQANIDRQRSENKSKWWEIGGNLRHHKRHFRREAIDYGNPNADYCSANQLGDHGNPLKRGRANHRRQRPQKLSSPKEVHEPNKDIENRDIFSRSNVERAHISTATKPFKYSGQRPDPKSAGTVEVAKPNYQLEWSFPRDSAIQRPASDARQPLASLDHTLVVNEAAQSSPQADAIEHSDDSDSFSDENGAQAPTPEPWFWFGQNGYVEGQNPGPAQL
ncbi:hypothetical protein FS837_007920 [Tulasnella sp. UAMH 9824]|nr:hypothetical protein FS837_007920 [Tulasnella sp. UAMH 9824]